MVTNVNVESIIAQKVEKENAIKEAQEKKAQFKKVEFNTNHYLNTRLEDGEKEKEIVIRLLPFSTTELSPFKKIHVHSVKAVNENGQKVWQKFMCPVGMGKSDKCPFCETSVQARKLKFDCTDEAKRKEYGNIEFMNKQKDYWLVRCIDRDHEDHGVKFWRFPDAKNGKGIWDEMYALFQSRQKRGTNIFDLYNGKDLIVKVSRQVDSNGKKSMVYHIQDDDRLTPLSDSEETMEKWVNDPMRWEDVYSIKDYDYMALVVQGEYPVWSKNLNRWIAKSDAQTIANEAKVQEIQENLMPQTQDFSSFTINTGTTKTEQAIEATPKQTSMFDSSDDDLPF